MKTKLEAAASAVFPTAKADKGDATTRAARAIMDLERTERDAKTARLRALRLEMEAKAEAVVKEPAPKKAARAKAPKRAVGSA